MNAPKSTPAAVGVSESETEFEPHGHPAQDPPKVKVKVPWMALPVGIGEEIEELANRLVTGSNELKEGTMGVVSMGQLILVRSALRVAAAAWRKAVETRERLS